METSATTSLRSPKAAMAVQVVLVLLFLGIIAAITIYNKEENFNSMWPKAITFLLEALNIETSESNRITCFVVLAFLLFGILIAVYQVLECSGSNRGRVSEA